MSDWEEMLIKFQEIDPMCDWELTEPNENDERYYVLYLSIPYKGEDGN